ncbi:hypothetical protein RJ639_011233 [Escallonia herrerae]|uniref:X8 domain-containing protein n=1 Tax=Escallonia herrerae TaxID=1293975 RepID=A0AA88VN42_9ASTE|nr:hypothetical protein RJ639_011233 [Escallonia herrerae]
MERVKFGWQEMEWTGTLEFRYEGGAIDWTVLCACGAGDDDGEMMVASTICEIWQLTRRLGFDNVDTIPSLFTCKNCYASLVQPRMDPYQATGALAIIVFRVSLLKSLFLHPDHGTDSKIRFLLGRKEGIACWGLFTGRSSMCLFHIQYNLDGQFEQWCLADEQTADANLQVALDWACGKGSANCSKIQVNQPCYLPNTVRDHASYAFNSYYQKFKHKEKLSASLRQAKADDNTYADIHGINLASSSLIPDATEL